MKKIVLGVLLLAGLATSIQAQKMSEKRWVRKQFSALNLNEKIGQLMVIRAHSNWSQNKIDSISNLIQQYNVGGLCFFQGGPVRQALQTNAYQSIAKTFYKQLGKNFKNILNEMGEVDCTNSRAR
jgi:opacity protein-like surface antigen